MIRNLVILILISFANISYALTMGQANVFVEVPQPDAGKCGLSNNASQSAVESVLRQNRISIESKAEYYFYLNTNAMRIGQACVADISLQVGFRDYVMIPYSKNKRVFANIELCNRGIIMSGQTYDFQSRINQEYRSMAEQCVSEIEKK